MVAVGSYLYCAKCDGARFRIGRAASTTGEMASDRLVSCWGHAGNFSSGHASQTIQDVLTRWLRCLQSKRFTRWPYSSCFGDICATRWNQSALIIRARGQCPDEFVRRHHSFYTWPLYTRKAKRMERHIVPVRANAFHRPVRTQGRIENDDSPHVYCISKGSVRYVLTASSNRIRLVRIRLVKSAPPKHVR